MITLNFIKVAENISLNGLIGNDLPLSNKVNVTVPTPFYFVLYLFTIIYVLFAS